MSSQVRRGPGPSSTLITPDQAGNVVGVDPHKRTLTATVVDPRGGIVASEHFRVSGDGHRALEAWARRFGPIVRFGVEGASAWGRHTAIFLIGRGYDVRDVCPNRTAAHDRARQRGKADTLDSERIARETLAHPLLPKAFKRAGQDAGPDQQTELLAVWWTARRSLIKRRQHLLTESEALLRELPLELIERLPSATRVRPRLAALQPRLMHALPSFRLSASTCLDNPAPWLHPRCDTRELPSYYGRVRQRTRRRYSAPHGFCRLESSLSPPVSQQRFPGSPSHVP
jgi:Transposase